MQDSEQRFRDFADSTVDWFWEMEENIRFSYFSEGILSKAGVDPESLLG